MSKSLVRTSLELFGYENDLTKDTKKRRRKRSEGALDLIPVNHRIVLKNNKKETVKLHRTGGPSFREVEGRRSLNVDSTEKNIERLLLLSGQKINQETSEKLMRRAAKKSYESAAQNKSETEESTAFTEEDFKKFEEEYHEL
ncbi:active regulator of SIRT1-like [Venturia canescens]|uniref:active regulator of SIRT1-like n=1 Tax=Venturia canescens TaxID=32260 RepID=UPI001C9CD7E4|nr:active regulator of SIRT1-like [Venturia canescens]